MVASVEPNLADVASLSLHTFTAPFFVWGFHVAVPLAFALLAGVRATLARRRARLADARFVETAPLEVGEAVIHGEVELARERSTAVRVEIHQQGHEFQTKNGWVHEWAEVSRVVKAEPFYVHERRGVKIRVEPSPDTMLIDELDRIVRHDRDKRTRIAELTPGENVYVIGSLVRGHDPQRGGYRDEADALVLRPPARGKMLCSTKPLGEPFHKRAVRERAALSFFLGFVLVVALFDTTYHARVLAGVHEEGEVLSTEKRTGKHKRCELEIKMPDGETSGDQVAVEYCDVLRPGSRVPIVHFGSSWFAHVGSVPGVHVGIVLPSMFVLAGAILIYSKRKRLWWEAKLVERSPGRLGK